MKLCSCCNNVSMLAQRVSLALSSPRLPRCSFFFTMISTVFIEGTSDILASLAQAEERKDRAIIYPLPLSKEREQVCIYC